MKKHSTLARQMLIYFGFIAAAALLITVEFVWAVRIIMAQANHLIQVSAGSADPGQVLRSLQALQNRAFLIGIVQVVVTLIVLVMLVRRITSPLQQMIDQARRISEGDLSRTIKIHRRDEIGLLGETINGLTSNIQEIVAFGLSTDGSLRASLAELRTHLKHDPAHCQQLDRIEETLSGFKDILDGFQLFPAPSTKIQAGHDHE
jgi:methyl-accepting chemotaxis protein